MDVVLPAPLTPAIITTSGLAPLRLKERSSGRRWSASSWRSAALTLAGSSMRSFSRARAAVSSVSVASNPASAIMSADSSSSNRFSSTFTPTNRPPMLWPVRDRPCLSRLSQDAFFGASCAGGAASATGAETGGGATGATACSTAGATIGTATGATAGATTGAIAGAWTAGACAAMGGSMAASGALRASDTGAGAGVAGTGAAAAGSDGAGVTTSGSGRVGGRRMRQARMAPREPTTRALPATRPAVRRRYAAWKRVLEWRARRPSGPARRDRGRPRPPAAARAGPARRAEGFS